MNRTVGPIDRAASTESGYVEGRRIFDDFATHNSFPKSSELTKPFLMGDDDDGLPLLQMMDRFANYLLLPLAYRGRQQYKSRAAAQYYSNFKTFLARKFNTVDILHPSRDEWSNQLYRLVKVTLAKQAFERGEAASDCASSIYRSVLISICAYLMSLATATGYLLRAVMVTLYLAVGRASETSTSTLDSMVWNPSLDCAELDWREIKTGKSSMMSFFPDSESFYVDWNHTIGCYFIACGGLLDSQPIPNGVKFLFPTYVNVSDGGIASRITTELKNMVGKVPNLTRKHTSQGFKHGAADDMSFNPRCNIVAIVARANWDYSGQVSCRQLGKRRFFEGDLESGGQKRQIHHHRTHRDVE